MKKGWKQLFVLMSLSLTLLFACDQKPKNPVSEYGDALIGAYKKGQQAAEEANLYAVRRAIEAYHAANDRYPQSLEEIRDQIRSEIDLSIYNYNPENGAVSIKK